MKMQTITTTTTTTTTRRRKEKFVRFSYNIFFRVAVEPLRFLHQFFIHFFNFLCKIISIYYHHHYYYYYLGVKKRVDSQVWEM